MLTQVYTQAPARQPQDQDSLARACLAAIRKAVGADDPALRRKAIGEALSLALDLQGVLKRTQFNEARQAWAARLVDELRRAPERPALYLPAAGRILRRFLPYDTSTTEAA